MATTKGYSASEIKLYLAKALVKENLANFSLELTGNAPTGSGHWSDTLFVTVKGTNKTNQEKKYNFLLKCSKSSEPSQPPIILQACKNEAYMYNNVFPSFTQFQLSKGIEKPFASIPKCYGAYDSETQNVIVLENLNKIGYNMWDEKKPLTRRHIDLVVEEYARFHATSIAIQEQDPKKFQELVDGLSDVVTKFFETTGFVDLFAKNIEELLMFAKGDMGGNVLGKCLSFKNNIHAAFFDVLRATDGLKVFTHGDCWNNNFMYKYEDNEKTNVSDVVILDWQGVNIASPILDLSYFLFACSSKEDIEDMDVILEHYYNSFILYVKRMGSNFSTKYPLERFLNEWRKYGKYGVVMCIIPIRLAFMDKDNILDMAASTEKGEDITSPFCCEINDVAGYKKRILPVFKYAVEADLI